MNDQNSADRNRDMMLTSPQGTPASFTVLINGAWPVGAPCSLEVKGNDSIAGETKTIGYSLTDREHKTYLDVFEQLAKDFGLRLPQNRQPAPTPTLKAPYREVLSENLAPGMLYGYGDPAVIRVEGSDQDTWYYLLSTSNDAPNSFPIIRSKDLATWEFVDYVFPRGKKPEWAADGEGMSDYWAPELHKVGDEFRIYFVARDKSNLELCIGVARSENPYGPFVADETPLIKGNVIDPHVFVEDDATAYLFWKEDNNEVWPRLLLDLLYSRPELITGLFTNNDDQRTASFVVTLLPWARLLESMERFQLVQVFIEAVTADYTNFYKRLQLVQNSNGELQDSIGSILHYMKTPMFAQHLTPDGSSLVGQRTKIIENDLDWEAHLVEGMWLTQYGSKYYLFYAGNDFSTSQYGIGVAIADAPLGPYYKMEKQLLQSTKEWWAPGHPSLVLASDEKAQLFLHAYFPGKAGYKQFRALLSIGIIFKEDEVLLADT